MKRSEFRQHAHELVDWMADFLENIEELPVKAQVEPKEIIHQLADSPPVHGESFEQIFEDFKNIVVPGMTHWQHPKFFAYFNANSSPPSVLAEMLIATLGAQCMIWDTSPAAAEMEERMMSWLSEMLGLSDQWDGVIQDTASTATLIAILSARERATKFQTNKTGIQDVTMRIYCTTETHSSIEKAVKIAGIGAENTIKISVNDDLSMNADALRKQIIEDRQNGYLPIAVIPTLGTTSTVAIDDLKSIAAVAKEQNVWLHVDAAWLGTAFILPEYRNLLAGIEDCDSLVFNPHKWMFVNFDCTAYFVKEKEWLIRTFEILPEYLKTSQQGKVNDYRDWGIALGRRFRALKLWFVIRSYGVSGIQKKLRNHIRLAEKFESWINDSDLFEIVYPRALNFMVFRCRLEGLDEVELTNLNQRIISEMNKSGRMYLTHTKVYWKYGIRISLGQTYLEEHHLVEAWEELNQLVKHLIEDGKKNMA